MSKLIDCCSPQLSAPNVVRAFPHPLPFQSSMGRSPYASAELNRTALKRPHSSISPTKNRMLALPTSSMQMQTSRPLVGDGDLDRQVCFIRFVTHFISKIECLLG